MSNNNNGFRHDDEPAPDEARPPKLVPSRPGRMVSIRGLIERVVEQVQLEYGESDVRDLRASASDTDRRKIVRNAAEYIFGVESVQLSRKEQSMVIGAAFAELFNYGPLDDLFADDSVTTITLEGANKVAVRRGPGAELTPLDPIFDDTPHMRRTVKRLLRDAGAELREDLAIVEVGLIVHERRVCVTVANPPFVPELAADIRVHPKIVPTLNDLVGAGFMDEKARDVLEAIMQSEHGVILVGETESGKTTLLSTLIQHLPDTNDIVAIERAGELDLPEDMRRLVEQWPVGDGEQITFGERIQEVLAMQPRLVLLDEVRADEPETIAPLLSDPDVPRQIWSFRGTSNTGRTRAALGMLARMADRSQPEAMVFNLYERLPYMVMVKRRKGHLQLQEIGEWQFPDGYKDADDFVYADYVSLLENDMGTYRPTGKRPKKELNLPDSFWEA